MSYFNIAQQGHIVNVMGAYDIDSGAGSCDAFSMENWSHASIIISFGVAGGTVAVTLSESTTAAAGTDIAFKYAKEITTLGDTMGALTQATSTGITTTASANSFYVIEIDAADLSAGYNWVQLALAEATGSTLCSAIAVLSGGRYSGDESATAIA